MIKLFILTILFSGSVMAQSQFQSFLDFVNSLTSNQDKMAAVDSFMIYMESQGIPFIEDSTANFVYRGDINQINLTGDMNGWNLNNDFKFERLSGTDFYYISRIFELNARLDYKFIVDGNDWILDPKNPSTILGGFGPNSELAMPDYIQPWEILYQNGIQHGTLVSSSIASSFTNKSYQLFVYLPPDYLSHVNNYYPTAYFQDGTDYLNLGSARNILDNLINSRSIEPIVAVFVKPNNRNREYAFEDRYNYVNFFVHELVPLIDSIYRTQEDSQKRLVIGDSFGANISALISYMHPDVFAKVGLHSAAFWPNNYEVYNMIVNGEQKEISFYSVWGTYESLFSNMRNFRDILLNKGYDIDWQEYPEGHSWGLWRANIDVLLTKFFPYGTSSVTIDPPSPSEWKLYQNYPNPFNPMTKISFEIPVNSSVKLQVYNIQGKLIETLLDEYKSSGSYSVIFNPENLSSGIYFYRLTAGNFAAAKKLTYIK